MHTPEEIAELLKEHNLLVAEYKKISEYEDVIPNVGLAKIIAFFFNWFVLENNIQTAFTKWILCFDDALKDLDRDELKNAGDLLRAWVQAEIDNASGNKNIDADTLDQLKRFRDELNQRIQDLDTVADPNKHLESIKGYAQASLGLAFTYLFRGLLNDQVRGELRKRINIDPLTLVTKKFVIMYLIKKILIRIFGEAAGKSIFGWFAIVENLAEFVAFLVLRGITSSIADSIDVYRYKLLATILECGKFPIWPFISEGVFISGDEHTGGRVVVSLWCHCASKEGEGENIEVEWSEPHRVPFADGTQNKAKVLDKQSDDEKTEVPYKDKNGEDKTRKVSQWSIPIEADARAIEDCSSENCEFCVIYAEFKLIKIGSTTTFHMPLTIKPCN